MGSNTVGSSTTRRGRSAFVGLVAMAALVAAGCTPTGDGGGGPTGGPPDRPETVETITVDGQAVTLTRNKNYSNARGGLEYDLYQLQSAPTQPIVLYVHGGFWQHGSGKSKEAISSSVRSLVTQGWTVASMDYQGTNQGAAHPTQVLQVKQAVAHLAGLGYGGGSIRVVGHSAGGHLALMAATTYGEAGFQPGGPEVPIAAVVSLAGPTDLYPFTMTPLNEIASDYACGSVRPCYIQAEHSPIHHVDAGDPPTYQAYAQFDVLIPSSQSGSMHATLGAAGVDSTRQMVTGADHDSITSLVSTTDLDNWLATHG